MALLQNRCWIDLETTGLDENKNGIIQIAGGIEIENRLIKDFDFKCRPFPDDIISEESQNSHGYTINEIMNFPTPEKVFEEFVNLLKNYVDPFNKKEKFLLVGYNARFDYAFLRKFFEKNNYNYFGSYFWFPPLDVMNLAAFYLEDKRHLIPNFRLDTVAKYLGIEVEEDKLHDAHYDIVLTYRIFKKLKNKLED